MKGYDFRDFLLSLHRSLEETFHLVVGDDACHVVVEVNVRGTGDDEQFLVTLLVTAGVFACGNLVGSGSWGRFS